jgi:hypothetical protein
MNFTTEPISMEPLKALTYWFGISSATVTPRTWMKWERKESHLSPTTTQLKAEGLQPPVWKRSQVVSRN